MNRAEFENELKNESWYYKPVNKFGNKDSILVEDVLKIFDKLSPVKPEVIPKVVVKNSSDFVKETAEQYGTELFNKLNDYEGFQSWCGKNNIYKANAEQLKQYFIKKIREALTEYESNFSG